AIPGAPWRVPGPAVRLRCCHMPIERRLDASSGVLWTTIRGGVTIYELRQHMDAVSEMGGAHYCEIIDTREAEPLFTARELPGLANHGRRLFGRLKMAHRAVIVDKTNLIHFGISRIFAALAAPWVTFKVFDNPDEAVTYIDAAIAARR